VPLFRAGPTAQGVTFQTGQYWTTSYYAGVGTVLLSLVALWRVREGRVWMVALGLFLALVLAWGESSLLFVMLRKCCPAIGFVRYPVKFVIVVLALAPLLAAWGLQAAAARTKAWGRFEVGCAVALLLLIGLMVALDARPAVPEDVGRATFRNGLERAAFLVSIFVLIALFARSRSRGRIMLGGLLLVVFWADLITHVPNQNPTVPPSAYAPGYAKTLLEWNPVPEAGRSRAMISPSARSYLSQNQMTNAAENFLRNRLAARADCNLLDGIPQVDGFFSLVPRESYRITTLPYRQPARELKGLLDFMGVVQMRIFGATTNWIARPSALPLVTAGQEPVFADDNAAYEGVTGTNVDLQQTVYLPLEARGAIKATGRASARILASEFTSQAVTIQAEAGSPSLVVIAQSWYPGWKAAIDGRPVKLWRANYAFQAVEMPAGTHEVRLRYRDSVLTAGGILSGVGLLAAAGLWLRARRRAVAGSVDTG
jgi:hypothetical protein